MEENLALVIDKQSEELTLYKNANEDLKAQLRDQDKKLNESEARYRTTVDKIKYYESTGYTVKVIDISQGTPEYDQELFNKCNTFFNRGCAHILWQFHQYIYDKTLMCQAYVGTYADPRFRDGCDLVPYTEDELKEITDLDQSEGRV